MVGERGRENLAGEEGRKVEMVAVSGGDRQSVQRPTAISRYTASRSY